MASAGGQEERKGDLKRSSGEGGGQSEGALDKVGKGCS